MNIGGFMKQSFVDFPETICAVIFTNGCNLNCWYCHNKQLIKGDYKKQTSLVYIYDFLERRKGFIDGVVISGGEPTLQGDLENVIDELKQRGFKVKLDTNGTNPEVIKKVLPKLDYIAMDIKNSLENYHKTVGSVDIEKIKESIKEIMANAKDYEFRTTFSPDITLQDIEKMGQLIKGAKKFALQTYNPQSENAPKQDIDNYKKALNIIKLFVHTAFIR